MSTAEMTAADEFIHLITGYCLLAEGIVMTDDLDSQPEGFSQTLRELARAVSERALASGLMFDEVLSGQDGCPCCADDGRTREHILFSGAIAHPVATCAYRIASGAANIASHSGATVESLRGMAPPAFVAVLDDPDVQAFLDQQGMSEESRDRLDACLLLIRGDEDDAA